MTDTQHTPGPWYSDLSGGRVVCDTGHIHEIAFLPPWLPEYQAERTANARLIAASPEMLAALGALLVTIDAQIAAGLRWDPETVAAARAAIAKATGGQS